jgi:prolipoprotein diacylglyceryltransferase
MAPYHHSGATSPAFPRYFKVCGRWVNSYKVFLCVGVYVGVLVSAAVAERSGVSALRMGAGSLACALAGMAGARIYYLLASAPPHVRSSWAAAWDPNSGGWSVFGALLTMGPLSFPLASTLHVPAAAFWDYMSAGILAGGFWVRLGCVFNGCCGGRETTRSYGVRLHDTCGVKKRRVPVQFLEMGWWLLGLAVFIAIWPLSFPPGTYALGVLGWYGFGRFWLEPLREAPDVVSGRIRINQIVAAALFIVTGIALVVRAWAN